MISKTELKESLVCFLKEILILFDSSSLNPIFVKEDRMVIKEFRKGGLTIEMRPRLKRILTFPIYNEELKKDIQSLSSYNKLIEIVTKSQFTKLREEDIYSFVGWYLRKKEDYTFSQQEFDEAFEGFWLYFSEGRYKSRILALLHNFDANFENLKIDGLTLRRLDSEIIQEYIDNHLRDGRILLGDITMSVDIVNCSYLLELDMEEKCEYGNDHLTKGRDIFNEFLIALRLFKTGEVNIEKVIQIPLTWKPMGGIGSTQLSPKIFGDYKLPESEIEEFKSFFESFKKIKKMWPMFELLINRLNYSHYRHQDEDRIIDFFIGFEAMFLQDSKFETIYKLAMRFAHIFGENKDEKYKLFLFMKNAYDIRSMIVHGSVSKKKFEKELRKLDVTTLKEFTNQLNNYYIKSLRFFMKEREQGKVTKPRDFDRLILT